MSDDYLDAKGLQCPLPVLKARKRLKGMPAGAVLVVEATDPMSEIDFQHFCHTEGHELIVATEDAGIKTFKIRRASQTG